MPLFGSREGLMLVLRIEMLIADIKAIVEAIGANGVNAHLPCWFCSRVLNFRALKNDSYRALLDDGFVDLSSTNKRQLGYAHQCVPAGVAAWAFHFSCNAKCRGVRTQMHHARV